VALPSSSDLRNIEGSGSAMFCAVSRRNSGWILSGPGDLSGLMLSSNFSTWSVVTIIDS